MPRRFRPSWSVEDQEACFASCAITTVSSLPVSISRMNRGGDQRPSCSPRMRRGRLQALSRVTGLAAVRCIPSSTNGTFCRARSFPLEPSSRGASIPCLSWPVEISWPIVISWAVVLSWRRIIILRSRRPPYGDCPNGANCQNDSHHCSHDRRFLPSEAKSCECTASVVKAS